jgi:peroxiredoxin
MRLPTCAVLLVLALCQSASAAELLTFRGKFLPVKGEGNAADKSFTVQVIAAGEHQWWTLTESGRGAWPWTERFGKTPQLPALLYVREEGASVVPLPDFAIARPNLAIGSDWQHDGLTYRVVGEEKVAKTDAWQVTASNNYGPKRRLAMAKDGGHVLTLDERVVIGQGDEFQLKWELVERGELDAKSVDATTAAFDRLDALRTKLAIKPQTREHKWNAEQLAVLQKDLPSVAEGVSEGPLVAVLQAAKKDTTTQDDRTEALAKLEKQAVGQALDRLQLTGAGGEKLTAEDLQGKVTILHFWDYRDTPLEEPYGQVGYLDFLARQKSGAKVFGVMVDERLTEPQSRGAALASARKVKAFMNLSYPILLDERGLLKQIGDPRATGAKLPLWVVIGKDGKITHYHPGFYDVKRDQGLADLEAAISAAK